MAGRKPDLYRWDKFSKPRVYSRTQKVTSNNDIQDWIKKVEEASDDAAAAAFGGKPVKRSGLQDVKYRVDDVHLHDAAYAEAQDLLQQWVNEKVNLDDTDLDFETEPWAQRGTKSAVDVKHEWDQLLSTNDDEYEAESYLSPVSASERSKEVYGRLLGDDVDETVEGILQNMLDKDVVGDHITRDLGLDNRQKHTNPATKMALRQQQVKENREKREAEKKRKLQESQAKKEAQLNARRIVSKEAAEKEAQRKREETGIQREMKRIRKEMAEEQRCAEEKKKMDRLEKEKKDLVAEAELERQHLVEAEARKQIAQEDVDRQRKIAYKIQKAEARNTTVRLRLLHRYFSGWYKVVSDRRIQLGKARAMADWKLLLRTWRAWKTYTVAQNNDKDTQRHFEEVKERQRKQIRAEQHYRTAILRRCFAAWLLYVGLERKQRELASEQNETKSKMASFLQAAASGSLWSKTDGNLRKSVSMDDVSQALPQESARQRVEDMFSQPARPQRGSSSARSAASTARSTASDKSSLPTNRPMQAWQLTRKHVQLTKEEIANLTQQQGQGQGQVEESETGRTDSSRSTTSHGGRKPWEKKYVVNTTEHRTAAQAKILEQQQTQIKEQQRLIEELTYLQKQQMLQTQLTQQQLLQQHLGGTDTAAAADQSKLEKHLKDLQANLVDQGALLGQDSNGLDTNRTDSTIMTPAVTNRVKAQKQPLSKGQLQDNTSEVSAKQDKDGSKNDKVGSKTDRSDVSRATSGGATTTRTVSSTNSKHSNFLKSMEARATDRAKLKAEREAKRRQAEEERMTRLAAEAEEARLQEEEEKRQRAEQYRERKRQEKEREIEREREADRMRAQHTSAELQYQRGLLKFRGWQPWRRLVEIARNRQMVADQHYKEHLQRKVLQGWHAAVREEVEHQEGLADHMLRYILIRRCFNNWRRVGECVAIQEEKAVRFFTSRLRARVFTAWRDHTEEEKMAMWKKERQAREHNVYRMKKTAFSALRRFPRVRKADEERERRRAEMRKKVASMLTDYDGHEKMRASAESDVSGFFS